MNRFHVAQARTEDLVDELQTRGLTVVPTMPDGPTDAKEPECDLPTLKPEREPIPMPEMTSDRSLTLIIPMPADEERREILITAAGIFVKVAADLGVVVAFHRTPVCDLCGGLGVMKNGVGEERDCPRCRPKGSTA